MLAQVGLLIVYVLVQMVLAAQVATIYFRVFFLDPFIRHGRVSFGLRIVTLVQVLVMAFAMVLLFERLMLFVFPAAPEPSWYWANVRVLIVSLTFIGNFYMQIMDDTKRLAAMLNDKQMVERMVSADKARQDREMKK